MEDMNARISDQLAHAVAALQAKAYGEAEELLRPLLAQAPDLHPARFYLGTCLLQQEHRKTEGAEILKPLLEVEPVSTAVLINLGLYYFVAGNYSEAEPYFRQALEVDPDNADLHHKLGCVCVGLRRSAEAAYHFQQALIRNPAVLDAYSLLISALRGMGRFIEAYIWAGRWKRADRKARKADAEQGMALGLGRFHEAANRAMTGLPESEAELLFYPVCLAQIRRDFPTAIAGYKKVLQLDGSMSGAHFNLSLMLLGVGEFTEGWREFDHRFGKGAPIAPHGHQEPEWDGRELNGQGILVHSEQGMGDVIQFMRFFPLIQQRGGRVIFSSYPDILALMKSGKGAELVHDIDRLDLSYQWQIPLLSLGKVFVNHVEDIPASVPYLNAEPQRTLAWRTRLEADNGLKAGVVWAGNPEHANDHNRSMGLVDFAPLAEVGGVSYFALQKGVTVAQAVCPPAYLHLVPLSDEIADFNDTAAIIEALDLVICVDTSVAHLAGALGKTVWLLLPDLADWRWIEGREDSPWYPTMRIFKRKSDETWLDMMCRVSAALDEWSEQQSVGRDAAWQLERDAIRAAKQGDYDGASTHFSAAIRQGGQPDRLALQIARVFHGQQAKYAGRWPDAAKAGFLAASLAAVEVGRDQLPSFWQSRLVALDDRDAESALVACLHEAGQYQEAIALARLSLEKAPQHWEIRYVLAQCLRKTNLDLEAEEEYAAVLKLAPRHPEAGINRAMALNRLGKPTDALRQLQYTSLCHPFHPKVRLYLSILLFQQRQFSLALIVIEAHRQRWSQDNVCRYWHGAILRQLGRYEAALAVLSDVTADGGLSELDVCRELAYTRIALDWTNGETDLQRLLSSAPLHEQAQLEYEYGLYLLSGRHYAEGWKACEARRAVPASDTFVQQFPGKQQLWQGEPLEGRTLLVFCEQGFGDTFQFLRYLDRVEGACIVVHQDGLTEVLTNGFVRPNTRFISRNAYRAAPLQADCHIDLLSLPHVLATADDLLGECVPYLKNKDTTQSFSSQFAGEARPKVGLVWSGNAKHLGDHWRSIDLLTLAPLFLVDQVAWYSLQKGVASNDVLLLPAGTPILNAASLSDNFYETLLVIEELDLVIAVDTAVAHLAAAMGKPVWLLLPQQADWRWGRTGDATDWYPSMRLFRQQIQGEWGPVIANLISALERLGPHDAES